MKILFQILTCPGLFVQIQVLCRGVFLRISNVFLKRPGRKSQFYTRRMSLLLLLLLIIIIISLLIVYNLSCHLLTVGFLLIFLNKTHRY